MLKYFLAALLFVAGGANAVRFYEDGRWTYFVLIGIAVPLVAVVEFLRAHRRGPEAASTADRLIPYIFLGLMSGTLP
jgi:hypothetical protein